HLTAYFLPVLGSFPRATGLEVSDASGVPVIIQELDGRAKERGLTRETIEARLDEVLRQNRLKPINRTCILKLFPRRRRIGFSTAQSFRIVLAFLVAVAVARVAFPPDEANPAGDAEEATTACSPAPWNLAVVDPDVIDADSYGSSTAIFLDSLGRRNFIYAKGPVGVDDWGFKWAISTPNGFQIRTLPAEQASARPSVASDSQDRIHLCWRSGGFFGEGILSYGKLEGEQWHEEIVDPEPGSTGYCSIAVDANDNPHIAYTPELANRPMRYAHWDGTAWVMEDVIVQGGFLSPSLTLDSAGEPAPGLHQG